LPSNKREYGRANLKYVDKNSELFRNISPDTQVWMSHGDTITRIPDNINIIGSTADVEIGAFKIKDEITYGIQFHPEVYHTTEGKEILRNFVVDICGCKQSWTPVSFVETTVTELRKMIGEEKVVLGLSGGVDSSVAAILLHRAIGKNLTCIFVDNGLLRKDEFRKVGKAMNMSNDILKRHPFPGPGLGIRILGEVTREKIRMLQDADYIFIEELKKHGLYDEVWQAAVILLPVQSVGVMGDERTYEYVVVLRAVSSTDGMTADWYPLPYEFLSRVSGEIINKVKGINRVVYDISSKPPATIEWE